MKRNQKKPIILNSINLNQGRSDRQVIDNEKNGARIVLIGAVAFLLFLLFCVLVGRSQGRDSIWDSEKSFHPNRIITLMDLIDYQKECFDDTIIVGYKFIIDEGDKWSLYFDAYKIEFRYKYPDRSKYIPPFYDNSPEDAFRWFNSEESVYKKYKRCELIKTHKDPTFEGFIEWITKKYGR